MANFADAESLYDYYHLKPWTDITDRAVQRIASAYPSMSRRQTVLQNFLQGTSKTMSVNTPYVRWKLGGVNRVSFRLLENMVPNQTAPGINFSQFRIKLDTNLFKPGDTVAPELNREFVLSVESEGLADGDGFVYVVQVVTDDPNEFFPTEFLEPNLRYIKAGSSKFSEGSSGWGSALIETGMSWVEFEVQLNKTGKEFIVTDEALQTMIVAELQDKMGRTAPGASKITTLAELQFDAETRWEKEQDMVWGIQSSSIIDPTTGLHRRSGPGLYQFLNDGNVFWYNDENASLRMFTDWLETVWYDRIGPDNADVVFYTGKPGLEQFDRMVKAEFGDTAVVRDVNDYLERRGNVIPGGVAAYLKKNPQFNAYQLPTYGTVRVEHWPILDSTWLGGAKHPKTGKPMTAYQYICLDYGVGEAGGSNIVMVNREGAKYYGYESGALSPQGPINQGSRAGRYMPAHRGRFVTLFHGDEYGFLMQDVLRSAIFKLNYQ
jgi:hypothetical protein